MMTVSARYSFLIAGVLASLALAAPVAAETVAGLQLEIAGGVDARVRADIEEATAQTFAARTGWSFIDADKARARLNPIVRDCFTSDCLKKAGASLDARTGFTMQFAGESQIYDWTLTLYDLRSGNVLNSIKGACELCGRAEVAKSYSRSLNNLLSATAIPERVVVDAEPRAEKPVEKPVEKPIDDREGTTVRLRVSVVPAEAAIYLDENLIGKGDVTIPVDQGRHELRFVLEGHRGLTEAVIVGESSPELILLRVHLSQSAPAPRSVVSRGDGPIDRMGSSRAVWGWIAALSGASLLATGIVLARYDGDSACVDGSFSRCPEVYDTAGAAITTSVLGGVLMSTGIGLLSWEWLAGSSSAPDNAAGASVKLAPAAGRGQAGVSLFGRF
ncbi:MAG: PEGA domain-containing protein [Bradymonadaceae bacterium]|nr:PEGA domain-containing protein [Lujinxingiaceae bacterium]